MISLSTSIVPLLLSLSYGSFPAAFRSGEIQTGKLRFRSQTVACVIAPQRRQDRCFIVTTSSVAFRFFL